MNREVTNLEYYAQMVGMEFQKNTLQCSESIRKPWKVQLEIKGLQIREYIGTQKGKDR